MAGGGPAKFTRDIDSPHFQPFAFVFNTIIDDRSPGQPRKLRRFAGGVGGRTWTHWFSRVRPPFYGFVKPFYTPSLSLGQTFVRKPV
jgi:hypothetical protein